MEEKIMNGKKNGMVVLLLNFVAVIASIVGIVFGGIMVEDNKVRCY